MDDRFEVEFIWVLSEHKFRSLSRWMIKNKEWQWQYTGKKAREPISDLETTHVYPIDDCGTERYFGAFQTILLVSSCAILDKIESLWIRMLRIASQFKFIKNGRIVALCERQEREKNKLCTRQLYVQKCMEWVYRLVSKRCPECSKAGGRGADETEKFEQNNTLKID